MLYDNLKTLSFGYKVNSQSPIDDRMVFENIAGMLDISGDKQNRYYEGMIVYCKSERAFYEWKETTVGIGVNYTYPNGMENFGVIYGGRTFDFIKVYSGIEIDSGSFTYDCLTSGKNNTLTISTNGKPKYVELQGILNFSKNAGGVIIDNFTDYREIKPICLFGYGDTVIGYNTSNVLRFDNTFTTAAGSKPYSFVNLDNGGSAFVVGYTRATGEDIGTYASVTNFTDSGFDFVLTSFGSLFTNFKVYWKAVY